MADKGNIGTLSALFDVWAATLGDPQGSPTGHTHDDIDIAAATAINSTVTITAAGSGYTARSYDPVTTEYISIEGGMVLSVNAVDQNGGITSFDIDSYGTHTYSGANVSTTSELIVDGVPQQTSGVGFKVTITVDQSIISESDKRLILKGGQDACFRISAVDESGGVTGLELSYSNDPYYYVEKQLVINGEVIDWDHHETVEPLPEDYPVVSISDVWNDGTVVGEIEDTTGDYDITLGRGRMYNVGDEFILGQSVSPAEGVGGSGCKCTVTEIGPFGQITAFSITSPGSGYYKWIDPFEWAGSSAEVIVDCQWTGYPSVQDIMDRIPGSYYIFTYSYVFFFSLNSATAEDYPSDGSSILVPSDAKIVVTSVTESDILNTYLIADRGIANNYSVGDKVWLNSGSYPFAATVATLYEEEPTAPTATARTSPTNVSFKANWQAFTGALSYQLDIAIDSEFTSYVTGYQSKSVSGLFCLVTGLPFPNSTQGVHTYYYRVRAVTSSKTTDNSNVITAAILTPTVATTAADGITNVHFIANWNAVDNASGYYISVTSDEFAHYISGYERKLVISNSCLVVGLTYNTAYKYKVSAVINGWETAESDVRAVTTTAIKPKVNGEIVFVEEVDGDGKKTGRTEYKLVLVGSAWPDIDAHQVKTELVAEAVTPDVNMDGMLDSPVFTTAAVCGSVMQFEVELPDGATGWYVEISLDKDFSTEAGNSFRSKIYPGGAVNSAYFDTLEPLSLYYIRALSIKAEETTDAESGAKQISISKSEYAVTTLSTLGSASVCPSIPQSVPQDQYMDANTYFSEADSAEFFIGRELNPGEVYVTRIRSYSYNTENSGSASNASWSEWSEPITFIGPPPAPTAYNAVFSDASFHASWGPSIMADRYTVYVFDADGSQTSETIVAASPSTTVYSMQLADRTSWHVGSYFVIASLYDEENEKWVYSDRSNVIAYSIAPIALPASGQTYDSFTANWTNVLDGLTYLLSVARNYSFTSTELNPNSSLDESYSNRAVTGTSLAIEHLMSEPSLRSSGTKYYYKLRAKEPDSNFYTPYSNVIQTATSAKLYVSGGSKIIYIQWT